MSAIMACAGVLARGGGEPRSTPPGGGNGWWLIVGLWAIALAAVVLTIMSVAAK